MSAEPLPSSPAWRPATRVNVLVITGLVALTAAQHSDPHVVAHAGLGLLACVAALASASLTYRACRDDLDHHVPDGRTVRPDHYGTRAWVYYMGGVLTLAMVVLVTLMPVLAFVVPIVIAALMFFFGLGLLLSLAGLLSDAHRGRAALGLVFPAVALVMVRICLSPLLDGVTR